MKPHLGEVLEPLVADLELYTKYASTLDRAVHLLTFWKQRNKDFAKIVNGIEVSIQLHFTRMRATTPVLQVYCFILQARLVAKSVRLGKTLEKNSFAFISTNNLAKIIYFLHIFYILLIAEITSLWHCTSASALVRATASTLSIPELS